MSLNKNLSNWKTFRRLWSIISPHKIGLFISIIALIINAASDIFMLSLLQPLIDHGFGKANIKVLQWMPIAIIGIILVRGISGFISNYCISWVSGNVVMKMRRLLFSHIMGMPVSFFDQQSTGTLLSRITYDSEQIASSSSGALITLVRESFSIIGLFIMMFYYSWQLSFILIILVPIVSFAMRHVSLRFHNISKNIQNTMCEVTTRAEQMLKGHKEVLIFGGQKIESNKFASVSNKMRQQNMKLVSASSISDPIIQLIASMALAFILYAASFPKIMNTLTAGTITVVFSSMLGLMRPLKALTNVNSQFQKGVAACETLFYILDTQQEIDVGKCEVKRVKGEIDFRDVSFKYPGRDIPALKKINFTIQAGKKIALVGPSGSGKSTIVNLLTRFYDINNGKILIDGKDLKEYKLRSLRNQVALVSQNVYLFHDTIANNIAYACGKKYSRKEIQKAAQIAYAMDFINKMKNGLDTIIGENGISLSGGQKQRIAIARALLHDCPILLLDEATSALDSQSEKIIQKTLNKLQKNRTSIIISHRLSTIKKVDKIIVLKDGEIIECGTHKDLIKKNGSYAKYYRMQSD